MLFEIKIFFVLYVGRGKPCGVVGVGGIGGGDGGALRQGTPPSPGAVLSRT